MNRKTTKIVSFLAVRLVALPLDACRFLIGYAIFAVCRNTPPFAHRALISLHAISKGWFGYVVHALWRVANPPETIIAGSRGSMKLLNDEDFLPNMRQRGFHIFRNPLPVDLCRELLHFAQDTPATTKLSGSLAIYDANNPIDSGYYFDEPAVFDSEAVQRVVTEVDFPEAAQRYLGSSVQLSIVMMWWSALIRSNEEIRLKMAQLFHYDMDRIRWIKFFIYLTPVDTNSGPHTVIEGSHRPGNQPWGLLRHHYARIQDEEVFEHFSPELAREICGPAGTIVAVDTRAFHKGKPPIDRDRLIFEVEYTDSLFGASYTKVNLNPTKHAALWEHHSLNPNLYRKYETTES